METGGNRPGGLPDQGHLPQAQPVATGTVCETCVLLGHAVVAPRDHLCVGVFTLVSSLGNSLFSGSESQFSAPQANRSESMKLLNQEQPRKHVGTSGL